MTQCTKCNAPMIDNNPFDESEPEWVCEKCGGTDGYTPEGDMSALVLDQVQTIGDSLVGAIPELSQVRAALKQIERDAMVQRLRREI